MGRSATADELSRFITLSAGEVFPKMLKDKSYRLLPRDSFRDLMVRGQMPKPKYATDIFDCDDWALCFDADMRRAWANRSRGKEALACGQVLLTRPSGARHAQNWYMDAELVFRLLEPQSWIEDIAPFGDVKRIEQLTG